MILLDEPTGVLHCEHPGGETGSPVLSGCDFPALIRAIEALGTIKPTGPFERALACLLIAAYRRRLGAIIEAAPAWVSERILSASERIGDRRAMLWTSEI
jgi:hypothetical protein